MIVKIFYLLIGNCNLVISKKREKEKEKREDSQKDVKFYTISIPIVLTAFIALDQQIIENGVLYSVWITSFVSLHLLLSASKWMPRKSQCLAASPATLRSFFYSHSDPTGGRVFPRTRSSFFSQDIFPRLGRKNRCKKNAAMRSPFAKDIEKCREGKGGRNDDKKKMENRLTPGYRNWH